MYPSAFNCYLFYIIQPCSKRPLSLSLAQVVQHLAAVKTQQIGICKKMSQDTKLKMQSLISESAAATASTKKRASGAGLVTKGLVSAAAAEALSKRSRPSASTGVRSRRA